MPNTPEDPSLDLTTLKTRFASSATAMAEVHRSVRARLEAGLKSPDFIEVTSAEQVVDRLSVLRDVSASSRPSLFGVPFAVKDNIDVAGSPTTAACRGFSYTPERSATVVRRLQEAGAISVGKTNLDQFATGLVGVRSPYGACRNSFDPRYISGGSSSGSATAVAKGLVSFSLGTDTAGSGRVPAAFNNIVGYKPTRGRLSTAGVVPACRSLDCVSIFALTCGDAFAIADVAAGHDPADAYSRTADELTALGAAAPGGPCAFDAGRTGGAFRFGVPRADQLQFFGCPYGSKLFAEAVDRLQSVGGQCVEIDFSPFMEAARLLYEGPWVAERWAVLGDFLSTRPEAVLPVTRSIIEAGAKKTARQAFEGQYALRWLIRRAEAEWRKMDVLLVPTAGRIYTVDEVEADPVRLNTNLGYYTNFTNLMDLCGVAVPSGITPAGLPFGVTVLAPGGCDERVLRIGDKLHRASGLPLGATSHPLASTPPLKTGGVSSGTTLLAVVGAHLAGQPLNHQLTERKAKLVRSCTTSARYRLYALPNTTPPKPGLVRLRQDETGGVPIELEVWELTTEAFGSFVAAVPPPMGIGSVELEDGTWVKGFICEHYATVGGPDISHFGGWRGFLGSLAK